MNQESIKFRVAICGGGVGGLTLAFCLSRCPDIEVDVYEAAAQFTEVGAGIGMWWRTWNIMRAIGLEEDVVRLLGRLPWNEKLQTLHYRKADQPEGVSFADVTSTGGLLTLHRAEFHHLLLTRIASSPRVRTFTSKRLRTYTSPAHAGDPYQLAFTDGTTARCDVLVGADGVKSAVRPTMLEAAAPRTGDAAAAAALRACVHPRWSGMLAYRVLIPSEKLAKVAPSHRVFSMTTQYLGNNKHIMAYPISHGRYINFAGFEAHFDQEGTFYTDPWVADVSPAHMKDLYSGFEPEVRQLIDCIDGCKVSRWAVNVVPPLPTFVSGRVALLGDAAHAMTPFQGAGAGQAIEDAYILSAVLAHPATTRHTAARALRVYSHIRLPLAQAVAERSRCNGMLFALVGEDRLNEVGRQIQASFEGSWEADAALDLQRAIQMLEGNVDV